MEGWPLRGNLNIVWEKYIWEYFQYSPAYLPMESYWKFTRNFPMQAC